MERRPNLLRNCTQRKRVMKLNNSEIRQYWVYKWNTKFPVTLALNINKKKHPLGILVY